MPFGSFISFSPKFSRPHSTHPRVFALGKEIVHLERITWGYVTWDRHSNLLLLLVFISFLPFFPFPLGGVHLSSIIISACFIIILGKCYCPPVDKLRTRVLLPTDTNCCDAFLKQKRHPRNLFSGWGNMWNSVSSSIPFLYSYQSKRKKNIYDREWEAELSNHEDGVSRTFLSGISEE